VTDVTSETLRQWREAQGWDVLRMARELRKAARDTGEDVAAHHGLVKMIPWWAAMLCLLPTGPVRTAR
jgi:hypothetical protein